jgi:hypothetical protein
MIARECCEQAEVCLQQASLILQKPTPAALEECAQTLAQVVDTMEKLAGGSAREEDPAVRLALTRICVASRNLSLQIEHASNLVRGWMQLQLGEGYTRGGSPVFSEQDAQRHLEA